MVGDTLIVLGMKMRERLWSLASAKLNDVMDKKGGKLGIYAIKRNTGFELFCLWKDLKDTLKSLGY